MNRSRQKARRAFKWQVLLILLPLLLLAALGVISLKQDKRLARQTAADRAQALSDSLAAAIWEQVQKLAQESSVGFTIGISGELISPRAASDAIESLEANISDLSEGARLFQTALVQLSEGETNEATRALATVALNYPDARGDTGLRLGPLAGFKLLELAQRRGERPENGPFTVDSVCSNIVTTPGILTPLLLRRIGDLALTPSEHVVVRSWERTWELQERARNAYAEATAQVDDLWKAPAISRLGPDPIATTNVPRWTARIESTAESRIATGSQLALGNWYVIATGSNQTTRTMTLLGAHEIGPWVQKVAERQTGVPEYMTFGVELAGAPFSWFEVVPKRSPGPHRAQSLRERAKALSKLAQAELLSSRAVSESNADLVRVNAFLADPSALYAEQARRTVWFGGLIAVSSGAALFGLFGAWRSFREQEQLNRLKSDFVSSVSHELRAPIASVRLMSENLEHGRISEEGKRLEYFRFIGQECRRLSALIENVLDYSRIEQDRKRYEFEVCDLEKIVACTAQLMTPVGEERKVGIRVDLLPNSGASAQRVVDGKALQQALVNLVDNAIKHSPPGATVTLGLRSSTPGPAELWVEDCGEGIPESEHEKIFERFYRLGSELRRQTQGVGIGLSIVKHIVEAHRGSIRVRSAPGQGSRFTITLPQEPGADERVKQV